MVSRAWVCVVGMVAAVACADRRAPDTGVRDTDAAAAADTVGCELAAAPAHPDGEALVREFVRRDAAGEFTAGSAWFATAVDCPGHEAAPDAATLARDPRVRVIGRAADSVSAEVRWERVMVGDVVVPGTEVDTLTAVRTPYGWRVRSPALNPHVPVPPPPPLDSPAARAPAT
jgi:hypothetical protein